ncbi:MAG: hypothetical protein ACRDZN_04235 [Acidimicrobiales bacterium]
MFLAHCNRCGRHELRGPSAVTSLINTSSGIELRFLCASCGAAQRTITGVAAAPPLRLVG